jgi:hypothetical protein
MDEHEAARMIAVLRRARWVQMVRYPGAQPNEVSVLCIDGSSWRITRPIHLVRLKFHYRDAAAGGI